MRLERVQQRLAEGEQPLPRRRSGAERRLAADDPFLEGALPLREHGARRATRASRSGGTACPCRRPPPLRPRPSTRSPRRARRTGAARRRGSLAVARGVGALGGLRLDEGELEVGVHAHNHPTKRTAVRMSATLERIKADRGPKTSEHKEQTDEHCDTAGDSHRHLEDRHGPLARGLRGQAHGRLDLPGPLRGLRRRAQRRRGRRAASGGLGGRRLDRGQGREPRRPPEVPRLLRQCQLPADQLRLHRGATSARTARSRSRAS